MVHTGKFAIIYFDIGCSMSIRRRKSYFRHLVLSKFINYWNYEAELDIIWFLKHIKTFIDLKLEILIDIYQFVDNKRLLPPKPGDITPWKIIYAWAWTAHLGNYFCHFTKLWLNVTKSRIFHKDINKLVFLYISCSEF